MTLDEYMEALRGVSVAVVGLGVSNRPLLRLLLEHGANVTVRDKGEREKFGLAEASELESRGCRLILGSGYLQDFSESVVFRTPGLHPDNLEEARERGAVITSEMEAFFSLCPCRIIAVTGSDGKTTTTTVISELLKAAGYTVHLGGNIGTPLLDRVPVMKKDDWVVLELSSFQLLNMTCRPDVAVVTNVTPNHLDVHHDYQEYQDAKKQIFLRQTEDDVLVLNADNEITRSFAGLANSSVRFFSRREEPENGCFLRDGVIYRSRNGRAERLMDAEEIRIKGLHNIENYMAAFSATEGIVPDECCRKVARTFKGVPHRLEKIRVLRGVTYFNDSIASSPTRTIAGLRALPQDPIILIAGGYDKHIEFDKLGDEICHHVKELFLTGFTAEKILDAVRASAYFDPEKLPVHVMEDFRETVLSASAAAEEGDVVLLSPACASFDHFKNFEERGDTFRKIVMELE